MMNAIRREQNEVDRPILERMDHLNQIRREIGWKMAQLNIELGNVNRERENLKEELKSTNGIFYGLKKQFIQANPRIAPQSREDAQ